MKLNKYIHILLAVALLSPATSCDDFLDVEPANTQTTENFYKTEAQFEQALVGLYGVLKVVPKYLLTMSEFRSDNIWIETDVKQNDYVDVAVFNSNGLLTDNLVSDCWSEYFTIVASANTFLDKIEAIEFNDEKVKRQYTAEARFIRAYAYFDLVRFFGRVPASTSALSTEQAFNLKQSEAIEVYNDIIVPDLEYAIENLAETAADFQGKERSERISNIAARAMLGKVYLTMAGFPHYVDGMKNKAQTLFKEVLDYADSTGKYWAKTADEWDHMWIHENDNKYYLFELQYIAEANQGNPMVTLSLSSNPGTEWCGDKLITGTKVYVGYDLLSYMVQKDTLTNIYFDKRAAGTVNIKETVDEDGNIVTSEGNTFYVKFFENKIKRANLGYSDMDATIVDRTYWPQNYPLLRLEDIMLLYAECAGNTEEGRKQVNKIRERAGVAPIADNLTEEEYQKAVADERRYELCQEGHRWFDLVRRNEYVETLQTMFRTYDTTDTGLYTGFAERVTKDVYLYPIPQSQIQVREGLYTQNPGY